LSSQGIAVSSLDHHNITELLLKVAINTINQPIINIDYLAIVD
jgi:hypothetical protein